MSNRYSHTHKYCYSCIECGTSILLVVFHCGSIPSKDTQIQKTDRIGVTEIAEFVCNATHLMLSLCIQSMAKTGEDEEAVLLREGGLMQMKQKQHKHTTNAPLRMITHHTNRDEGLSAKIHAGKKLLSQRWDERERTRPHPANTQPHRLTTDADTGIDTTPTHNPDIPFAFRVIRQQLLQHRAA